VDPLYYDESRKYKYINDDYETFEKSKIVLYLNRNSNREISQHLLPQYELMSQPNSETPGMVHLK